ncbi:hypothetical protein AB0F72_25775 [Actinoplanes sp. NPDC023936]|uniref:hypothetical protein n=1 Tax=Actinoplanes sp. NPDC023936 TaxID=3154910 RepID=UPI0033BFBF2B
MTYPPPVDPFETPQHTQPLFDQPGYGHPGSPHPGPAQSGPAHSGPAHAGYMPPTFPMTPPPAPPARSRTPAIILLSVAIALVLLVGGGAVSYLAGKRLNGNDRGAVAQGESASAVPSATVTDPQDTITISEPDTLNGHDKIEAEELSSLTTELEKELEGYPGAANAFGAAYGALGQKKLIAALAAEVDIDDPQRMLDTMFQSFSGESQLTGVSPASTGALGGVAQCGDSVIGKENVALCGWADEGSVGMFLFFYETAVDVKGDFPDMRAEIETKG